MKDSNPQIEEEEIEDEEEESEAYSISPGNLLDSRTSQLDDALNEKLENAFHKQTAQVLVHSIAKIASEYDPIDLAHAVTRLPPNTRVVVYENLPDFNAKIIFIINTDSKTRASIFRQIDDREIQRLVEKMPPDEAVWVLDDLTDRRLKRILDVLEPKKASRIRQLLAHDRHSAGRLMTNEFFAFRMNTTIGEVAASIRDNPGIDLTRRIFVLNDEGELIGFVPARNLIVNPPFLPIRQVMRPILHTVGVDTSRDEIVDLVTRYKIPALPVVDSLNHLLGVITYEDVVEMMEDISDETIASIAGTAEDVSEYEPAFRRFLGRAPWLLVTLCAGLISALIMMHFSERVWFAFLPFFVPLIAGMSGNVGIVCSTILVRGISTGELTSGSKNEAIAKELVIGLLVGSIFGLLCGCLVFILAYLDVLSTLGLNPIHIHPFAFGAMIACGVFSACLTATCLGTFSPFFFVRMRIDPAIASGPIVTAFNDVLSSLTFFLVARLVYLLFA